MTGLEVFYHENHHRFTLSRELRVRSS